MLLSGVHMQSVLRTQDEVASHRYKLLLLVILHEVDEDEGLAVKIVRLIKHQEPLGATIKVEDSGAMLIARIMKGSIADRSRCIRVHYPLLLPRTIAI